MNKDEIISGEKFQELCPVYCGTFSDLTRNPRIRVQTHKHLQINKLYTAWDNPILIFCYSCSLHIFIEKLHLLQNPFVLVSHNEDNNIDEKFQALLDSPLLKHWFAQNVMMYHPKLSMIPIGMANSMWTHGNKDIFSSFFSKHIPKTSDIYFFFSLHTNYNKRIQCQNILTKKGLVFGKNESFDTYLHKLASSKFAISPEGNGIDCHRVWECFYLGVIPILLRSVFTEILSKELPCILLDSWEDFHVDKILSQYNTLIDQMRLKNEFMKFSYHKDAIFAKAFNT